MPLMIKPNNGIVNIQDVNILQIDEYLITV